MSKPRVLIMVHKGVAEYLCIGDVEVQVVDEDNIDAGDPPSGTRSCLGALSRRGL